MKRILIYLYIIFTTYLSLAAAPLLSLRQFSTKEGLPNSMVRQVVQDNQGFIWIATFYGLYRYDGYEMVPFKSDIHRPYYLPSNDIVCLATDKKQQLWIGTQIRKRMLLRNKLLLQVNDGKLQVVVNHKASQSVHLENKKQLSFEIKDLNYTDADEEFIRNAIQCVNRHLSEADFDIPQFAEELCTSRTTLFKKLKSMTGMNATAFIRSIRLKAAAQVIEKNPNMRISELAYQVGFNDPKYFSVCFKKEFGLSPSEYIEKLKR